MNTINKKFSIKDSNGKCFTVYAKDRTEARAKAAKISTAKTIYIL